MTLRDAPQGGGARVIAFAPRPRPVALLLPATGAAMAGKVWTAIDTRAWALRRDMARLTDRAARLKLERDRLAVAGPDGARTSAEAAALLDELDAALTHLSAACDRAAALLGDPAGGGAA